MMSGGAPPGGTTTRHGKLQTAASSTSVRPGSGSPGRATQTIGPGSSERPGADSNGIGSTPKPGPRRFVVTHPTASASPTRRTTKCPDAAVGEYGIGAGAANTPSFSSPSRLPVHMRR
ncbi:MAG TPA: hypothetical protein PKA62_03325 [Thermoanaerobaculia bacterium]|nr:hypothetical protein [Thermoanaerobaculia bacterium]